jgi:hypothetical protein
MYVAPSLNHAGCAPLLLYSSLFVILSFAGIQIVLAGSSDKENM